ncbi:MAG: preprotein translocase subunit SecG [Desulfuromonas sp.]
MTTVLLIIHVMVSISLVIIVLLQAGKGAETGASFGGGASQTMFGASGGQTFLSKSTTLMAAIFMLTSLSLAYFHDQDGAGSIMPEQVKVQETAPAPQAPAVPSEPPAPTPE